MNAVPPPSESPDPCRIGERLKAALPVLRWLPAYERRSLPYDVFAGLTLAAYAVPVSLAYASLAGLPSQAGVYCYLLGGLGYCLFGTSRQLAIGPTAAISLLVGTSLAGMAAGNPAHYATLAALTAVLVAAVCLIAWSLRLSEMVNFISETILVGFKAGAALTIAATQLPKLFGVGDGAGNFFSRVWDLSLHVRGAHVPTLVVGLGAIGLLAGGRRLFPRRPIALWVVALSILLMTFSGLSAHGVKVVGAIQPGLPRFTWPGLSLGEVDTLLPLALACFLLAYVESTSAARAFALKHGTAIDARQELLGLGMANLAAGLFQGYPSAGGLSQTAVSERAGARSPLAGLFASLALGVALLFLTGLLRNLPEAVLAAVVVVAVTGLVDVAELRHLWRVSRFEFKVALVALAGVLLLGILKGVLLAAVASIVLMLQREARPHLAFLGRIPGTNRFGDLQRHPDNEIIPGVLAFRVESELVYYNVDFVATEVLRCVSSQQPPPGMVVCDLSTSPQVDLAGVHMLAHLQAQLAAQRIAFAVAEAHASVRDLLRAEGLEGRVGHIDRRVSVAAVIEAFRSGAASGGSGGQGRV